MTGTRRLALVESPAQLLNVLELDHADPQDQPTKIAVLAPAGEPTRTQLRAMTSLARQDDHEHGRVGGRHCNPRYTCRSGRCVA